MRPPPSKKCEKKNIFRAIVMKNSGTLGKNHVKFGNFVNFRANIINIWAFLKIIFGQKQCKIRAFFNFS